MRAALMLRRSEAPASGEGGDFWATAYPIIPHPAELIFGLVSFAILYWVVAKVVVPRLEKVIAERADAIEGGMARAEQAQSEAAEALRRYRTQLAEAQDEAARIREGARQEGARIIAELRGRAQEEADRVTAAAQQQLEAERQAAMVQLRGEVGRLAVELASRVVGESVQDDARATRVVDRFLDELETGVPAGSGAGPVAGRRA